MNDIERVQEERNDYGTFENHAGAVEDIMRILKNVNKQKNGKTNYPRGFKTALFYLVHKLVRLATTPTHTDSALDLSSYADLWLKEIKK